MVNQGSLSVELLTNATLIDNKNVDWLSALVSGFNVSVDGSSADIHDKIRVKGSFARTMAILDLLVENNVRLAVRMTYFGQAEDEVEKLLRMLQSRGVKTLNFRYVVPLGNASGTSVDPVQHTRLILHIWELGKELGMKVGFSDPFPELLVSNQRRNEVESDQRLSTGVAITGCSVAFSLL